MPFKPISLRCLGNLHGYFLQTLLARKIFSLKINFYVPGQYLFIESSSPRRPGDSARIQSEQFSATPANGRCMKFWYHMLGPDIGNLTVYMNETGASKLKPLWRLSGNQGNQWLNGKLPIKTSQSYMVGIST